MSDSVHIQNIAAATPTRADFALISDTSASGVAKLATIEGILALGDHFAECRNPAAGISLVTLSTTPLAVPLASNVSTSMEVAGGPLAGTVLTADQANDAIVIPPKTRVLFEGLVTGAASGAANTVILQAILDGSVAANTEGYAPSDGTNGAFAVRASGIVDNTTTSSKLLKLGVSVASGSLASSALAAAMLRCTYIKALA